MPESTRGKRLRLSVLDELVHQTSGLTVTYVLAHPHVESAWVLRTYVYSSVELFTSYTPYSLAQ